MSPAPSLRFPSRPSLALLAACVALTIGPRPTTASDIPIGRLEPRVVNGVSTGGHPSVAALVDRSSQTTVCSATLIGCRTVLTAAHCFCDGDTASTCGSVRPSDTQVFLQHAGFFDIAAVRIAPSYRFGERGDLAIVELASPVTGVAPSAINTTAKPSAGSDGTIVGFGVTDGSRDDSGIKRRGNVRTASCSTVPNSGHVCWNFENPVGPAGQDSNTCFGDSGGPLFVDFGQGPRLSGVTSGGDHPDCRARDTSFDADVFSERAWIQSTAQALGTSSCGGLAAAGSASAPIQVGEGNLGGGATERRFQVDVPAGTRRVRFALDGEDGADFDLYVQRGSLPTASSTTLCGTPRDGVFEACEVIDPAPGTYHVLVDRFRGSGAFQLVSTRWNGTGGGGGDGDGGGDGGGGGGGGGGTSGSPCSPDASTLCLGDGRFAATVDWRNGQGTNGSGTAVPLAADSSGLFWFFGPDNVEMLVKVLDGCGLNDRFWVLFAATTDVRFDLRVEDTETGTVRTWTNPQGRPADAVVDTEAFATCP